ncbi:MULTISPECIES: threonine/serine ThrE exporter family protein [Streptomyces]|uniref:Threonine/serine exporter family protein n=1 Tax=Streptomyces sudanensis TaxID=436397 RepID=A0ABY4TPB4_9ACTN|nr:MULTISPECIES: threonine/serine exporter family protein [Streptomyces]MCP9987079.1 threonine/serine exporter family protein [Streptomyces sudanensis]URN18805.1 threonine/serine exporter family protein [Streptomyces sudanensis]
MVAEPHGPEEDRKPQPDEAHSAFAPPAGVEPPGPSEDDHPSSEFAVPEGFAAEPSGERERSGEREGSAFAPPSAFDARLAHPAYTPAQGLPRVRLSKDAPWQDRMRTMLRMPVSERPLAEPAQRNEEGVAPAAPRVLDLTLRIGELLLAGGEGAEDVEAAMFAICRAYGMDRCEPTVTFTLLSVTYQPSLVDAPVTASRIVRRRGTDYTRLAAVYQLVTDISTEGVDVTLEDAYRRLALIRRNRHPYPGWVLTLSAGGLAGAASVLLGGDLTVFLIAAVGAMLGDRLAWLAAGRGLPEFYQFAVAAVPPAALGVAVSLLHAGLRPSAVITGGLFALIPGRVLVAAVQDGLTGFYITASARLLEVVYFFVAIVVGVLTTLYVGVQLGAELSPEGTVAPVERPVVSILAAMALSLTFGILLQQDRFTVLFVMLNGAVAWVVFGAVAVTAGGSAVLATALAAGLVGLFGQLMARYERSTSLPYVTAAIGPLLPGSAMYYGVLNIAQNNIDAGFASLARAVALALAIAIGVNLGGELARMFLRAPATAATRRAAKRTRGF